MRSKTIATRNRNAFTLIEVLVSMGILVLIMALMAQVFTESSAVWSRGLKDGETHNVGRAMMAFMKQDISATVADHVLRFQINTEHRNIYGLPADEIRFVSLSQMPRSGSTYAREAKELIYYTGQINDEDGVRFRIMRNRRIYWPAVTAYDENAPNRGTDWISKSPSGANEVAENIAALNFRVYYRPSDGDPRYQGAESYDNMPGQIWNGTYPLWVDIYFELLGEADANMAKNLSGATLADFVEESVQRFAGRAYLHNSHGYNLPGETYPFYVDEED